jgi:hypothetical protein
MRLALPRRWSSRFAPASRSWSIVDIRMPPNHETEGLDAQAP